DLVVRHEDSALLVFLLEEHFRHHLVEHRVLDSVGIVLGQGAAQTLLLGLDLALNASRPLGIENVAAIDHSHGSRRRNGSPTHEAGGFVEKEAAHEGQGDEHRKKFDENPRRYFAPLANEYRKIGDIDQAIFICQEYLPQQPGHMSGHIVYGQALYEAGRMDEARGVFETALALDPENLIALRHLGDIARAHG